MYLHYVGLPKGNPWCAACQCYVLAQHCCSEPHSGYAPSFFPKDRIVYDRRNPSLFDEVLPGDFFGIYFPEKKRIAHVGMVLLWGQQNVETYEGNTNDALSRDGDGFYHKRRLKRQIYQVSNWIDK